MINGIRSHALKCGRVRTTKENHKKWKCKRWLNLFDLSIGKRKKNLFSTKERDISNQQLDLFPVSNRKLIRDRGLILKSWVTSVFHVAEMLYMYHL